MAGKKVSETMGYAAFLERVGQVNDLIVAKQILAWDARTMMPPGGAQTRAKQEATLTVMSRDLLVSDDTRRLLDQAEAETAGRAADSVERAICAQAREAIDYHLRIPGALVAKRAELGAIGHDLRTPLAALRVRIESVEDEQDRARMSDTIAEMNRTLDDILSLARLGRPSEPVTDVDLAALVDAVVDAGVGASQSISVVAIGVRVVIEVIPGGQLIVLAGDEHLAAPVRGVIDHHSAQA